MSGRISTMPSEKRRRWRLHLTALFLAVVTAWLFIIGPSDLHRAIAETDALDPGWRLADLEAARAPVPDAENSALVIIAGNKLLKKATDPFEKWNSDTQP